MFGLGWPEILLCILVFVLVVPAGQWPSYGAQMGKWLRELKKLFSGIQSELGAPFKELAEMQDSLKDEFDFSVHNAKIMQQFPAATLTNFSQPQSLFNDLSQPQMMPLPTAVIPPVNPTDDPLAQSHLDNPPPNDPAEHPEFPPVPDAPGWQRQDKPPAGAVPPPP